VSARSERSGTGSSFGETRGNHAAIPEKRDACLYRGPHPNAAVGRQADGQKRQTTEIVANVMRMLTSRAEGAAAGASGGQSHARSADADFDSAVPDDSSLPSPEIADEDIPF